MTNVKTELLIRTGLNEEFELLPFGEQLLLWAIRLWVRAVKERTSISETLQRGFRLAGAPDAFWGLDDLMTIIGATAKTSIDIRCIRCPEISIDEHRLLAIVAAQQRDGRDVERHLATWLPPSVLRYALGPVEVLAGALKSGNLQVRPRDSILRQAAIAAIPEGVGNITLH